MVRSALPFLPLCLTMLLAVSAGAGAAEIPATPSPLPMGSPFGPGFDPVRAAPEEPEEKGAGIVEAEVVAAGVAEVEQMRSVEDAPALFGVVLDLRVEAGSTTPLLDVSSVVASVTEAAVASGTADAVGDKKADAVGDKKADAVGPAEAADAVESVEKSATVPVLALCLPTADAPLSLFYKPGATTAVWNVAIGDRTWLCGGRTARLALRVGSGGVKLSVDAGTSGASAPSGPSEWKGPLVLLFATDGRTPKALTIAGRKVDLGEATGSDEPAN